MRIYKKSDYKNAMIHMFQLFNEFVNLPKYCTYECNVFVYILPNKKKVIDHTMKEHQAKLVMKKKHNIKFASKQETSLVYV